MSNARFELCMGCLGNGMMVYDKAIIEDGDFKKLAHISDNGQITWYAKRSSVPFKVLSKIEKFALDLRVPDMSCDEKLEEIEQVLKTTKGLRDKIKKYNLALAPNIWCDEVDTFHDGKDGKNYFIEFSRYDNRLDGHFECFNFHTPMLSFEEVTRIKEVEFPQLTRGGRKIFCCMRMYYKSRTEYIWVDNMKKG